MLAADGLGYEVGFGHMKSAPIWQEREVGNHLFGHLRTIDRQLGLIPDAG
jgi:hypothetical protein